MSSRDADLYGDVADVLESLHATVDTYVTFLQEGEERDRAQAAAAAAAAAAADKAGSRRASSSSSLSTSATAGPALTRQSIRDSVPRLMELCSTVQTTLRAAARTVKERSVSCRSGSPSGTALSRSSSSSSSREEAGRVLVTRKLGDVVENAHMMCGLVKLQRQRQFLPRASIGGTPTMMDSEDDDEDDGPLRIKQLIRVTLYNLEDTERLLRLAYPDSDPFDVVAHGDEKSKDASSPLLSKSPIAQRRLTRPSGERNAPNLGSLEPGIKSPGSASSPSETPRSSTHTAPYVRRSVSQEPFGVPTTYVFPPPSDANGGSSSARDNSSSSNVVELDDRAAATPAPVPALPPAPSAPPATYNPTAIMSPRSILARARTGDGNASTTSRNTSRTSSARVRFAIDEPPNNTSRASSNNASSAPTAPPSANRAAPPLEAAVGSVAVVVAVPSGANASADADAASSLPGTALAATLTPMQPRPRRVIGLLSNPVVRRSSTESDDASRMSTNEVPMLFSPSSLHSPNPQPATDNEHGGDDDEARSGVMRLAPFVLRSSSQTSLPFASGSSGSSSNTTQTSSPTAATGANGSGNGGGMGADTNDSDAASSSPSPPGQASQASAAGRDGGGGRGGLLRCLSWSATPSVLSMATISVADTPRGILRTAPSRGSSMVSAPGSPGHMAHRESASAHDGADDPLQGHGARGGVPQPQPPSQRHPHAHVATNGDAGSSRPIPVGLPPRSPRHQGEQRLSLSAVSAAVEPHASLPLPRGDPEARVVTHHVQRLPGELWGHILAGHREEMMEVLRDDVVDLFNYGETTPVLRNEDVCDVHFTAVGTDLQVRIKLEHDQALTEAEVNLRLGLCAYPLMTALYEDFFKEYLAKEFDPIEDSSTTVNSSTMRYSDACSGSGRTGRHSFHGDRCNNGGDSDGENNSTSGGPPRKESTFVPDPIASWSSGAPAFSAFNTIASPAGTAAAAAALDSPNAPGRTSPLSIETDSRTASVADDSVAASFIFGVASPRSTHVEGGDGSGEHRSASEAESPAARPSVVATAAAAAVAADVARQRCSVSYVSVIPDAPGAPLSETPMPRRHSHTVRVPGVHWSRLAASDVPAMTDLVTAFVNDSGVALGVLPSEAQAACQEVRLVYGGGLVVEAVWDNGELYPGAPWLTAAEVDAALSSCLFPSVRAVYAAACAATRFDNDLAAAAARREGTGAGTRSRDVVQLVLPTKSDLDFMSSRAESSCTTNATPDRATSEQQQIRLSLTTSLATTPNFAAPQRPHASSPLVTTTTPTTTRVQPSNKSASGSLRLAPSSSSSSAAKDMRPRRAAAAAADADADAAASDESSVSRSKPAPLPQQEQQQQPSPSASAFDRTNSGAEAEPRMAVPQPTITSVSHATKGHDARAAGGVSRVHTTPSSKAPAAAATATAPPPSAAAPVPQTLNQLSVVHGVSLRLLRQWNPALAELDPAAFIPATVTVYVPRVTSVSPARVFRTDVTVAAAAAAPTATAAAPAQQVAVQQPVVAKQRHKSPHQPRSSAPKPAPVPPSGEEEQQQQQQQRQLTATAQAPPSHADPAAITRSKASATPPQPQPEQPPAQPACAPAPAATWTEEAAVHPPRAVEPAPAPSSSDAVAKSTLYASARTQPSAKATSPQPPPDAPSSSTAAPAPSRKVYKLPIAMLADTDEPRGIDVLLASLSARRLPKDGGNAGGGTARPVPRASDGPSTSSSIGLEEVTAAAVEQELGMRLDGLIVTTVRRASIAARGGVQAGDTLRTLDGQSLIAQSDFLQGMARQRHLQKLRHRDGNGEFTIFVTATTPRGIPTTYRLRLPPMDRDEVQPTSTTQPAALMPPGPVPQRVAQLGAPPPPPQKQQQQQQQQRRVASVTASTRMLEGHSAAPTTPRLKRPQSTAPTARRHSSATDTATPEVAPTRAPTSARLRVSSTGATSRTNRCTASRTKRCNPQQEELQQQQHTDVESSDTPRAAVGSGGQPVSARRSSAVRMRGQHS